ncbi:MAG: CocE/NonD family hydrolase [Paucibacter sp.]|nr:CocE/NonD family hydrolase [Roseateles sp.]
MRLAVSAVALALAGLISCPLVQAQEKEAPGYDVRANYTKYELRATMRDGARLFTVAYVPKDESRKYPILMVRTPYGCGPYGEDQDGRAWPNDDFLKAGYIFVCQDVRGRYMSDGIWIEMTPHIDKKNGKNDVDESSDTYDTVQWLLDHLKGHNGRVGMWGISYPGFYTAASAVDSHPALKAISPQAPVTDLYMGDDSYHGGTFMLAANFGFYSGFKPQANPTEGERDWKSFEFHNDDGYDFYLSAGNLSSLARRIDNKYFTDSIEHDRYDGYWKSRAIQNHLHGVKAAALTVGGWFDAEDLAGPLLVDRALREKSPGQPRTLVMGPWPHGGWMAKSGKSMGAVDFASETSAFFQKQIMLPFFEQHLKDGPDAKLPAAWVFETGTNAWRKYDAWPPREAKPRQLYLDALGRLSWTAPQQAQAAFDSYTSDPAKPVPFIGYAAQGAPAEYMLSDQRFASRRPDVLVYQTEPLESDVTVVGPLVAKLMASTSGTDVDWVVKLVDVYPPESAQAPARRERGKDIPQPVSAMGGYQQLVRGQPLRARYRQGFEKGVATVPGQVESFKVELPDVNHTFRRGHRIMVQVQSSWFPLIDLNPQSFVTIRDARPEDFKPATQRVYRWRDQASSISLSVVE